jgi:hypothetical protein
VVKYVQANRLETHQQLEEKMDIKDFLSTPEISTVLEDAFMFLAATGDSFNVTETITDGYYNHVTIVDEDEDGKSFAKTVKLSGVGAGCISSGFAALHILAALNVMLNEKAIIEDVDIEHYAIVLAETISNVKNRGLANVTI